jgi:hypothetical protein
MNKKEVLKRKMVQLSTLAISLFLCSKLNAQTDSKLEKLFFGLNIDSCQTKIEKEIENRKVYKLKREIDTLGTGNFKFFSKRNSISSCYKLENNKQSLVDCDSTLILLQPAIVNQSVSHGKVDYEILYGHRVSILMYFSDSIKAYNAYRNLADSISKNLGREYFSGDFTINNIVMGNSTIMSIDKKNNGYEYKRDLEISIRNYKRLYELKVDFVKLTIRTENCKNE